MTTSISSTTSESVYGQSVTLTATVSANPPGGRTPTGTVSFYDNSSILLGNATLTAGIATFAAITLSARTHSVTAVHNGSTNYTTSTSQALPQTVNPDATTTNTGSTVNPSV